MATPDRTSKEFLTGDGASPGEIRVLVNSNGGSPIGRFYGEMAGYQKRGVHLPGGIIGDALDTITSKAGFEASGWHIGFVDAMDPAYAEGDQAQAVGDRKDAEALLNGWLHDVEHPSRLARAQQRLLGQEIKNPMYDSEANPALAVWHRHLSTGASLIACYEAATAQTLGAGLRPDFDEKLFELNGSKVSALEYVAHHDGDEKAAKKAASYEEFLTQPIDDQSRVIFLGAADAYSVRTRGVAGTDLTLRHLAEQDLSRRERQNVKLASVGCGTALPDIRTILALESSGYTVGEQHFVDIDPMILTIALSAVRSLDRQPKVTLTVQDVSKRDPLKGIEPNSVHVGNAAGLAEYLYPRTATHLAKLVKSVLRPGGAYFFGNMHPNRDQRRHFGQKDKHDKGVIEWPTPLRMRKIAECLDIVERAGFERPYAAIPADGSVYAIYGGTKPSR